MTAVDDAPPRVIAQTPPHILLEQAASGSRRLSELVGRWGPMLPRPADLSDAEAAVEGLRRVLAELRRHRPGGLLDAL